MRRRHLQLSFPGSVHFITLVTRVRGRWFCDEPVCTTLLRAFEHHRQRCHLDCRANVLMPDHVHALIIQTTNEGTVPSLVAEFKKWTSRNLRVANYPPTTLWRTWYDDVPVPGPDAIQTKIKYIHENPVRKGLVELPESYLWSSAPYYYGAGSGIVTIADY